MFIISQINFIVKGSVNLTKESHRLKKFFVELKEIFFTS